MTERAPVLLGEAREDWKIFRALSDHLAVTLDFDTVEALWVKMFAVAPHLAQLDHIEPAGAPQAPEGGAMTSDGFGVAVEDFYFTNPIARASATMAACAKAKGERAPAKQGTGSHG